MKTFRFLYLLVVGVLVAQASVITVPIQARVRLVDDFGGYLDGVVQPGDLIVGSYTYDSAIVDSNPLPEVADYQHSAAPYGMTLMVNGLIFRTDPANVNFLVEIVNDYNGSDNFLLRSYNNLFDVSVPVDPFGFVDNHLSWQLDDPTMTALDSVALPLELPKLSDWESIFGLDISSQGSDGSFLIRAHVIPEPATYGLAIGSALFGLALWRRVGRDRKPR